MGWHAGDAKHLHTQTASANATSTLLFQALTLPGLTLNLDTPVSHSFRYGRPVPLYKSGQWNLFELELVSCVQTGYAPPV